MNLVEDVTNPQKKRVKLNPIQAALASSKATVMSLLHTVISKMSRVICNQRQLGANQKLIAARISTLENPLELESISDSTADYPDEEFTNQLQEDRAAQEGQDDEEDSADGHGSEESVGDHSDGGDDNDEEIRVEPEGSEYAEGDD